MCVLQTLRLAGQRKAIQALTVIVRSQESSLQFLEKELKSNSHQLKKLLTVSPAGFRQSNLLEALNLVETSEAQLINGLIRIDQQVTPAS